MDDPRTTDEPARGGWLGLLMLLLTSPLLLLYVSLTAVFHQSDLSAWARCAAQFGYRKAGLPSKTNSAAAFGSVMHFALEVLERELRATKDFEGSLAKALDTFSYYWMPIHIHDICEPVPPDGWLPTHSYASLRTRGVDTLRKYADLIRFDDHELLATEYNFIVPIKGTWDEDEGEPHWLAGSVDRLAARLMLRRLTLCVDDYKTAKDYVNLRQNIQFTAYCYASTQREFWVGARGEDGFGPERGEELFRRFDGLGRRGTWINLQKIKFQDAGWRGPKDYDRFALAVQQMHASMQADIYPLSISGTVCKFCDYRDVCGGVGVPKDDHGNPRSAEPADRPVPQVSS